MHVFTSHLSKYTRNFNKSTPNDISRKMLLIAVLFRKLIALKLIICKWEINKAKTKNSNLCHVFSILFTQKKNKKQKKNTVNVVFMTDGKHTQTLKHIQPHACISMSSVRSDILAGVGFSYSLFHAA